MTEFLHPSVNSRIIDNSFVFQTAQGTSVLFQCFKAERGVDNELQRQTSVDEALFHYGTPNVSLYGQGLHTVLRWIKAGGEAYTIRVLPTDATFATVAMYIATGLIDSNKYLRVEAEPLTSNNVSLASMKTMITATPAVSADGFTRYPVAIAYPYGRGKGYNGLGFRFSLLDSLDQTFDFRTYNLEITAKDAAGADSVVEGPFVVSLDPLAKNKSRESVYFVNVVNKYSQFMKFMDNQTHFDDIQSFINSDPKVNPNHIDMLFGRERDGVAPADAIHGSVVWQSASLADTTLAAYNAIAADLSTTQHLLAGTDGTWTGGNSEEALLAKAYSGVLDPKILDKKQYLFDVLLDANHPESVKNAMSTLASDQREDCLALLDCGFQANEQQTVDFRTNSISMSTFKTAIFAQDLMVYDEYNGESVKVTSPFFLADKIPAIDNQYGIHWPFVGPRRGVISGFEAVNFFPNEMWKETLYKKQINYIERDPKRTSFGSQLTSQVQNSALSDISNVRAILRMRRDVESMMDEYKFEFNDSITHESMNYNLNNYLQKWVANRCCSTISGTVYASDYDRQQKIARVKIELTFTGIIERIFVDFVVNR